MVRPFDLFQQRRDAVEGEGLAQAEIRRLDPERRWLALPLPRKAGTKRVVDHRAKRSPRPRDLALQAGSNIVVERERRPLRHIFKSAHMAS